MKLSTFILASTCCLLAIIIFVSASKSTSSSFRVATGLSKNVNDNNQEVEADFSDPLPEDLSIENHTTTNPVVRLQTNFGNVLVELFPHAAPKTVANFLFMVNSGFYDHSYFYRYVYVPAWNSSFVVQGGVYFENRTDKAKTVDFEQGVDNNKWTIGLARGESPNSGSCEYFVNLRNNSKNLGPGGVTHDGYCGFGRVISGFGVIRTMTFQPTHMSKTDGTDEFNVWPIVEKMIRIK